MRNLSFLLFLLIFPAALRAQISIHITASADTVCSGSSVTFTAAAAGSSPLYYQWKVNGINNGTDSSAFVTGSLNNGDRIFCELTDSTGDTVLSISDTITISILPRPYAGVITGPDTMCFRSTVTFSDSFAGGVWSATTVNFVTDSGGIVTAVSMLEDECSQIPTPDTILYITSNSCGIDTAIKPILIEVLPNLNYYNAPIWSISSVCVGQWMVFYGDCAPYGDIYTTDTNIVISSWGVLGKYPGEGTFTYNCSNYCGVFIVPGSIWVSSQPTINPIIASATEFCGGNSITVTDSSSYYYGWLLTNGFATFGNQANSFTEKVTAVSAGKDTIIYVTSNECGVARDSVIITINPPSAIQETTPVCTGRTELLLDTSALGTWTSKNTSIATIDSVTGILTGRSPGKDTITYTLANGCFVTTTVSVLVSPAPIVSASDVYTDSAITLFDSSNDGTWHSSDDSIAAVDPFGHLLYCRHRGITTISYVTANGCYESTEITVYDCSTSALIFPNPANEDVTIQVNDTLYTSYLFTNIVGQVLLRGSLNGIFTNISLRTLPPGVYFITLYGKGNKYLSKFLKE